MDLDCFECGKRITSDHLAGLGNELVAHARAAHDWPYPEQGIRNYAEATQRLTGRSERLEEVADPVVHQVTTDRIEDWLSFFDHDAFVGTPEWAACYCLEPHVRAPDDTGTEVPHWRENREAMVERLEAGDAFGYLAYVDGRPAGWVNASLRSDYALYRTVDPDGPPAGEVIGVSCFIIAPPYRRHGLADALLDRVIADAPGRGARWVEAYPMNQDPGSDAGSYRGPRSMFEERGFSPVEVRGRDTVMRLDLGRPAA